MMYQQINTIIFDLGAVLIDWDPKYLYKKLFDTEKEMDWFLTNICTDDWNDEQDAGRSFAVATRLLTTRYPAYKTLIEAYYNRWEEMLGGAIEGSVELLQQLKSTDRYRIYALTNWSAETFPIAQKRFDFLDWFDGIVCSGIEKDRKPFPSFYKTLFNRYKVMPQEALFIDDNLRNIKAAEALGMHCIHFQDAEQLKKRLLELRIKN